MGTTRKFLRNTDKVTLSSIGRATKLQKVVGAVTAMGFVLQPVAAMAQIVTNIDKVNGGATVEKNGNITNVWAGTVVNDVALNVFKKFDVGANDIANMYFHEQGKTAEAANLVNMVGSKININGTVNAIRNQKIGGNLYFLSSQGIAVGAGGVVNAGSLTLMTPNDRFMKMAMAAAGTDGVLTDATNAVINIFDDNYKVDVDTFKNSYLLNNWNRFQNMEVAINKTGTITVNGTINTIDGIRMKAAHINIGKDVDANDKATNNAVAKAVLQSGVVNFDNLVNLTAEQKQAAGLDGSLTANVTGDGNIVLAAVANSVNTKDDYAGFMSQNVQGYNSARATIDIGNAEIKAVTGTAAEKDAPVGTIDISATASLGGDDNGHFLGIDIIDTNMAEILGGKISKADAKISIDGQITADTINIAAAAENSYEEGATTNVGTLKDYAKDGIKGLIPGIDGIEDALGLDVDVSYAKLASNAEVTIGENAVLNATGDATLDEKPDKDNEDTGWRQGGALNISAISKLEAEIGAEAEQDPGEEEGNAKAAGGANKKKNKNTLAKATPNAGIAIVDIQNNATVIVKGKLLAEKGDANVLASAVNSVEAEAGVTAVADKDAGTDSNYVNAAVTVANVNNASKVEFAGDKVEAKAGGELNVLANAKNEVTTGASAESDKNALLNSAINITDANSSAELVVAGKLEAETMNLAAENTVSNEMQAANKLGESKREVKSKMGQGTLDKFFGHASKKNKKGDKVDSIGNYFSAGAAVTMVEETNSAKVTVKRGAQLNTTGEATVDKDGNNVPTLTISANNVIEDSFMAATSVVNNYSGGKGNSSGSGNISSGSSSGNTAAMASAAVLDADMDNSAQVIIEGSEANTSAPEIKGAHVDISANSGFEYDRLGSMIGDLKDDYEEIINQYKDDLEGVLGLTEPITEIGKYLSNPSVDGAMDVAEAFQNAADAITLAYVDTVTGVPEDLQTLIDDMLAFADISNYTNFYTAASTAGGNALGGKAGASGNSGQAKVAATGSININSIKNNAQVVIGKNAKLEANGVDAKGNKIGELNITAKAKQHDVALNGKTKYFIPTISNISGGATAIGGSVGVHDADVNSLIAIGEGASLTANDVNLKAENDLQHTAITFGGGAATNDGITGMFAYMEGQSNSIISVDDEASINAANKLALDATNNSTISNIIFDRTSAGNSAIGAAVGIVDYKVNNIAAIADNDRDATRGQDDEVSDLQTLVQGQLSDEEKAQLGTNAVSAGTANGKGTVTANEVAINANTSGTITGVSVAGTTAGATQKKGSTSNKTGGLKLPAQISGAGSASVNIISGNTAALLEGVEVNAKGAENKVKVKATDDSMIGAYSGAAALKKKGKGNSSSSGKGFSATLAGAIGYNQVNTGVTAQIKNASITGANSIENIAAREGAVVAAGLALGADLSGTTSNSGTKINAAASGSFNDIDNTVHAVMNDVSISGGDIVNIAQDKDIQVAGGINAQYASGGIGAGVAVSYQTAKNDIQSKIVNSSLQNVGSLQAYAASQLVQVGTAVSVGVLSGQKANGVEGAAAVNNLTNNVGVEISNTTISADKVDAKAFDGKINATITGNENAQETANKHQETLKKDGFDVDGTDAMADVNAQNSDVTVDESKYGQDNTTDGADAKTKNEFEAKNKGNLIITGATSVIANISGQGSLTAGGAVSTNNIKNNFTTKISGGTITANGVNAEAKSDTLMVGVAAGVSASTGQNGAAMAGSASVMQLQNKTTATIEKATINAAKTSVNAATSSRLINITGQVSATKGKVAAGLTTATNVLDNTTGAYIKGAKLNGKDNNATEVEVNAENNSDAYAIAVGVAASTNQSGGALNGAVAVNKGVNNTEAIIDAADNTRTTINKAGKISVNAVDKTKLKAISGGVTFSSGYAGVGGAVSYNQIGEDDKKQNITAQLNNADITTATDNTDITVASQDKSNMLAIAAGLAATTGQTGAAAQGSAATTILHKNNEASMTGTNIDNGANANGKAKLAVTANSVAKTITSADAIGITAGNAAGGAAVAVTNSKSDTKASISGGNMNLKSATVQADSKVDIINVGIGVAAATGQGGSIAGNVAVNNIGNNTTASIDKASMNASGTIGVLADSKEHIRNYAGALAATVGQGYAAGGLSTAVNVISGDTSATVSGSTITALGNDDGIKVTEYAKDSKNNKASQLTGLVVDADSAHEIDNVVVTAGAAVTSTAAVAASGTVTVNTINGSTVAGINSTNVNSGNSNSIAETADVSVRANDNTEIESHVGSAAVAASANAGVSVGEASDSNVMNRKVTAQIVGDSTSKNTVNADKLTVNAFNKHDILSNAIGIAGAGGAYAGVGVSGTTSVLKTTAETTAQVADINSTNNGLTINADHINKVQMFGNSAAVTGAIGGASVGTAIAVLNDGSKTEAKLSDSQVKHYSDNSAVDVITAKNDTDVLSEAANIAVSASIGAGVSGVITVNNMDNAVYTTIAHSTIGEESGNKAQSITAKANNKLKTEFASGSGSAGLVAAGVGVGVNTIDTSVVTDVSDSSLYATDVTLLADEERKIDQTYASAGVGGIGFNATVLVTNIGTTVSDKYGVDTTDAVNENGEDVNGKQLMSESDKVDISKAYEDTGKAIDNQNNVIGSDKNNTVDALGGFSDKNVLGSSSSVKDADGNVITVTTNSGLTNDELKNGATAGRGGRTDAKGVKVNVSGSTIKVSDKADIKADATTDANITVGSGTVASVAVGATVGILNVKRNSGVNITDSSVTANTIDIKSNQDGTAAVKVYQGGLSGAALNVTYSGVHLTGQNDINLKGATLVGNNGITVATSDTSTASLETIGVSGALTSSANIFVVDGKNESSSTITVDKGEKDKNSELTSANGNVNIEAQHGDGTTTTMEAEIIPVAVAGMASGLGFNAKVEDNSKTKVAVGNNQKFTGNTIDIKAENNSVNKVSSVTVNAALGAAIGATGVQVKGSAGSELQVGSNNTFKAGTVNLGAKANVINDAKITAVGAGFGSFMVNWATASGGTDVKVDVGDNTYNANIINIKGESVIDQHANATGAIAGMYTSGTNLAKVDSKENVEVKAGGNNANNSSAASNEVNITAEGLIKQKAESNGYGGAYVDVSPAAAITKSDITSNTKAIVTGNWNAKTMNVNALHDNQVKLDTDALKAAVVGLSGVWAFSNVSNTTGVELNGANITTDGNVAVEARNDISYENKVQGGGYGAVSGNAMDAKDTFALSSNVALKNSSITSKGKVDISAITGAGLNSDKKPNATIDKNVTLKSAGLVAGSLAFSEDKYTVDNKITVDADSAISTIGNSTGQSANDINLKAYDSVGFTDVATADTQGGVVGAASTKLNSTFNRSNTITVSGRLDSNYDAEINAGGDSVMNVTLKSNAYNKTAAPIVANPGLDYTMTQNNKVIIGARIDGAENIKTTRNINLTGDAGNTTIATQSESYKWTQGGTTSNSSLASTADGTQSKEDKLNNGVEVNGKLLAGKNDKLEITIEDGKDNFGDKMDKYAEEYLDNLEAAYNKASAAYDECLKKNNFEDAQKALDKAKNAKDTASDTAKILNTRKTKVDELNKTANETAKLFNAKAQEIYATLTSSENLDATDINAFLGQSDETIKQQMTANNKYTETDYNYFISLRKQAADAMAEYDTANQLLQNTVTSAGTLVELSNGTYKASSSVETTYNNALNAVNTIKAGAASLKTAMDDAQAAYETALSQTTVEKVNDYIHADTAADYVKVSADSWYTEQNNGKLYKSLGFKDYASGLTNRLADLEKLIKEYAGSGAETAFKEELVSIQNELIALGLGHFEKMPNSNQESNVFVVDAGASVVPTLELDNILVTGGNINIKGGTLSGSGTMKAVGNPTVKIENKSNYYLRVNDITIGSDGGNVKFNDVAVKNQQNGLNVIASPGDLVNGNNATINIEATADKAGAESIYKPDIGIFGTIYNPYGDVTIKNTNNNIYVAGKHENSAGSIKARNISLSAGGSITQGYTDGIVNISGDPRCGVSDAVIKKIQERLMKKLTDDKEGTKLAKFYTAFKSVADLESFLKNDVGLSEAEAKDAAQKLCDQAVKEEHGMYASGAIYINAAHINVNGTIQSGFDTYKVEIDQTKLDKLPNNFTGTEDKDFMTDAWLVSKADKTGVVYENGKFIYNIKAWYNPKTKEIFTEDIDQSGGGRINIVGAVASTGNGKLVALDGGATVTIDNKTNSDLKVGAINVDKVNGQITITDTTKKVGDGYQTKIYTRDEVTDGKATYDTTDGQMYIWTTGTSNQVITSYKSEYDSKLFGLDKDRWESQLGQLDKVAEKTESTPNQDTTAGDVINSKELEGTYKGFGNSTTDSKSGNQYQIGFERSGKYKQGTNDKGEPLYWKVENGNKVLTVEKTDDPYYLTDANGNYIYDVTKSDPVTTKKKKLWGIWGSHVTTRWNETTGVLTSYNFGLDASKDIGIEFIGNKDGGSVGIESAGSIKLNGDIRANDVTIKSSNGSIGYIKDGNFSSALNQKTIFTDNLKLEAGTYIDIVQQGVKEALDLSAKAGTLNDTNKENYIKINTLAGINTGDVYINNLSSFGDITLDVQGNILNGTRPKTVSGYASRNATNSNSDSGITAGGKLILKAAGGIGEENNMHTINAGDYASLLAESGDIWAKQAGSEAMKLKQVEAKNGDVHLEAAGGFVDALEDNQKNNADQDTRIQEWKAQGILSDKSLDQQKQDKYNEQVDVLKAQAKTNNILGDGYTDETARTAATNELIAAGDKLTTDLASDYNDYYATRKEMYAKQAALNEAISKKNNGTASDDDYNTALTAYNEAFAKYALAKKTYEDKKASAIEAYVTQKGYIDGSKNNLLKQKSNISQWLANYEELTHEAAGENRMDKYGWNQNQLLYALQDSIINPSAGSVSDVNKANIIGNNIYLKTNGDIGKVMDDQAFTIKMDELSNMFTNGLPDAGTSDLKNRLDKLAGARADDVTWGTSQIEVKRLTPISVKLNNTGNDNDGKVSIEAPNANNIYLIAKDSKLTMDKVISKGNVRLTGQEGIDIGTITGSNISLEGGKGDIKHGDDSILVGLIGNDGKINANAFGDIYLKQMTSAPNGITLPTGATLNNDMVLGSLAAKNIKVEATGNIVSGMDKILDANGNISEASGISYINARENLTLKTNGSVGTATSGLRVKNSGGVVDIDAENGAYLEAKGDGTLVLGTIKTGSDESDEFVVNSEGSLSVGREADAANNISAVEGSIIAGGADDAKANVKLTTANDLTFSGKVRAKELTTQSYAGNITQTTKEQTDNIEAKKLNISAIAGKIKLDNPYNVIEDIDIQGLGGSLDLVVSMEKLDLKLGSDTNALSNNYGGDFKITNNAGNINVKAANTNIYGDIELNAKNNITVKRADGDTTSILELNTNKLNADKSNAALLQDHGNITLTAGENITNAGTITANAADTKDAEGNVVPGVANITLNAKNVTNENALAAKTTVDIDATAGDIANSGTINAGQHVDFDAKGNITNSNTITADKNVDLNASGKVENKAEIKAANDAILTAGTSIESTANGTITAANNTKLNAGTDITVGGKITATTGNVEATTTNGDVAINNTVTSGTNTTINAGTNGSVKVTKAGSINSTGDTSLTANGTGTIDVKGTVNAGGSISGTTANGSITVDAAMKSDKGGIKLDTNNSNEGEKADITINGALQSDNGNIETTTKQGDVSFNGTIAVGTGDVKNTVGTGNVKFNNETTVENGNIENTVGSGGVKFNGKTDITTGSIINDVTTGNVKFNNETTVENGNIENTVGSGGVKFNGKTDITTGSIINDVTTGNVKFNNETTVGKGNIENNVGNGDVKFNGKTDITTGSIINDVTTGNAKINAETNVNDGNINNSIGIGDVEINGSTNVDNGNITNTVDNGNINFNAETNVNNGNIFNDAKDGNISHNANMTVGNGNIKDIAAGTITSPRHDEDATKPEVKLESINGSINLETTGNGDINIYEVIANNGKADIRSNGGNVYLYRVNGKEVILVTKNDIDAKHITADRLTTNGDDITLNIDQEKGMIIEELLATNNVNINKAKGSLDIEKLAVENKAHFDVNGMTTTVWGVAPKNDGSDSIYWFNVNAWKNGGDWMNLAFSEKQNLQRSNGALLNLHDYFYVYNQRFTAVDHLNQLLAENKADEYDINFKPEVVQYFRYDLYDLDELEQQLEGHADPAKVVVEA